MRSILRLVRKVESDDKQRALEVERSKADETLARETQRALEVERSHVDETLEPELLQHMLTTHIVLFKAVVTAVLHQAVVTAML